MIHPAYIYPLTIQSDFEKMPSYIELENQAQFEAALREFFAHPEVRKVVAALKAQAMATVSANAQPS